MKDHENSTYAILYETLYEHRTDLASVDSLVRGIVSLSLRTIMHGEIRQRTESRGYCGVLLNTLRIVSEAKLFPTHHSFRMVLSLNIECSSYFKQLKIPDFSTSQGQMSDADGSFKS